MRVRNRPGAAEYMAKYPQYVVEGPEKWQGKWQERFGNNHPILQLDIRQLFTQQKFAARRRRYVQINHRPQLFLPHHAQGAKH